MRFKLKLSAPAKRVLMSVGIFSVVASGFCTDPDPAFDWSTNITALTTTITDTVGANISAIMVVFGLFVAMALIWRLLRKAGARTR